MPGLDLAFIAYSVTLEKLLNLSVPAISFPVKWPWDFGEKF